MGAASMHVSLSPRSGSECDMDVIRFRIRRERLILLLAACSHDCGLHSGEIAVRLVLYCSYIELTALDVLASVVQME